MTLSPANQDFHPTDSRAMRVYAEAATHERVEQLISALENQSGVNARIAVGASE